MKIFVRLAVLAALLAPSLAYAQFSNSHPDGIQMPPVSERVKDRVGGPVAIGQVMAQPDEANPAKVTILQAPPLPAEQGGGLIQLKVFGWLEPYADALAQALIAAGFAWFMKSKYSTMLDETSRDALETFVKNRASSLIADGFVRMDGKTVDVHSPAVAAEANKAGAMIPDAMKRFGLTPDVVAAKIVDAIPQTTAGAAMVAAAHAPEAVNVTATDATVNTSGDVNTSGNVTVKAAMPGLPPTSGAEA